MGRQTIGKRMLGFEPTYKELKQAKDVKTK
ncbi:MAG: hypothetical protein JG778_1192 [Thermodesulfobacterium sp.]|nr:hypothetical protein [Thermodesulfobacterium sp.]